MKVQLEILKFLIGNRKYSNENREMSNWKLEKVELENVYQVQNILIVHERYRTAPQKPKHLPSNAPSYQFSATLFTPMLPYTLAGARCCSKLPTIKKQ